MDIGACALSETSYWDWTRLRPMRRCCYKRYRTVQEIPRCKLEVVKVSARHQVPACGLHARLASGGPRKSSLSSHRLNTPRTLPSAASFRHRTCVYGDPPCVGAVTAIRIEESCCTVTRTTRCSEGVLTARHLHQEPCGAPSACRCACTGSRPLRSPRLRSRGRVRSTARSSASLPKALSARRWSERRWRERRGAPQTTRQEELGSRERCMTVFRMPAVWRASLSASGRDSRSASG